MTPEDLQQEIERSKQILLINISNFIPEIKEEPMKCVANPTKGIYFKGQLEPFIAFQNEPYLILNGLKVKADDNCLDLNSDIWSNGKVILSKETIKQSRELLTTTPSNKIQVIKIAIAVVIEYLNSLCDYTQVHSNQYNLDYLILPEGREYLAYNVYQDYFTSLLVGVKNFVGGDNWHIYNFRFEAPSTMVVEKLIDYRIKTWYEQQFLVDGMKLKEIGFF